MSSPRASAGANVADDADQIRSRLYTGALESVSHVADRINILQRIVAETDKAMVQFARTRTVLHSCWRGVNVQGNTIDSDNFVNKWVELIRKAVYEEMEK